MTGPARTSPAAGPGRGGPEAVDDRLALAPFLLEALRSASDTSRGYDTKAQISGVLLVLSINPLFLVFSRLPGTAAPDLSLLVFLICLLMANVCVFARVLLPQRNPFGRIRHEPRSVRTVFYADAGDPRSLEERVADARAADWEAEIQFEIMKVSAIRDIKHRRFLVALGCAGASYAAIVAALVWMAGAGG